MVCFAMLCPHIPILKEELGEFMEVSYQIVKVKKCWHMAGMTNSNLN